jgi:hypothetical protein
VKVWRLLVGPLLVLVGAGAVVVFLDARNTSTLDVARVPEGARSIAEARTLPSTSRLKVAGFVFLDEEAGSLLCSRREEVDDRPACAGEVLDLQRLDPARLDLVVAPEPRGGYDAWSREEVVLSGELLGGVFRVSDVLPVES